MPLTSGSIYVHGQDITALTEDQRVIAGLARTFQTAVYFSGFTVRQQLRLDPDALMRDSLRKGLRLTDQRRQALLQVGGRDLVEAVVDLAGVDQIVAPAPADVESVPLGAVEREAGDGKGLALRAGLLDPVVPTAGRLLAVSKRCLRARRRMRD